MAINNSGKVPVDFRYKIIRWNNRNSY